MINGRFVVFGSPNYLKNEYGHGYTISIKQTKEKFNDVNSNIIHTMRSLIPQSVLVHTEGLIAEIQAVAANPDAAPENSAA